MSKKTYLYILKGGIFLSLISVFLIFKQFLFPFISSKQIFFNILIEILFIVWLAFIIKYPDYRPKKSYIIFGLAAFFAALLLSCFYSVDFDLSFWGDIERMLGVFHLLHFLAFFLIIITVFKTWTDWRILFSLSIFFAVIVSIKGLTGMHYSTIGNTAYVSGYLIFNIFFCLLLLVKEKNRIFRWAYLLPVFIMLLQFKKADTTGAIIGLGFSLAILVLLYAVLSQNKKLKFYFSIGFIFIFFAVGWLMANRDSDLVKNSSLLRPFSQISLEKNTFQTRLISWRAAWKEFPNHPLVGVGHGNYAIIFDKHFDPVFYNHTRSETYFDRAHNNIIDIASTSGLVGLLAYLSIFAVAFYYLVRGYIKKRIISHEFILLICLIIAYFVQNLAVFDSLVTYLGMMMVLGYIYWLANREEGDYGEKFTDQAVVKNASEAGRFSIGAMIFLAAVSLVMVFVIYNFNYKVIKMLKHTIESQTYFMQGLVWEGVEAYKQALSYNTVLDRDSRSSFIRIFTNPDQFKRLDQEKAEETVKLVVDLAEKNTEYNRRDSLNLLVYSQVLNSAAIYYQELGDAQKFVSYSDRALLAVEESIKSSPGRITIYFHQAQVLLNRGKTDKAIETLKYAVSLNEDYYDSHCSLSRIYRFTGDKEQEKIYLDKCLEKGGAAFFNSADEIKSLILKYEESEDWQKIAFLFERLNRLEENKVENWISLAKVYQLLGENEKARAAAEKVVELDPGLAREVENFIRGLE